MVDRCQATNARGQRCRANPTTDASRFDTRFCSFHQSAALRAEIGLGGPQEGSGRPRKPRIGELVAAKAIEHSEEIVAALRAAIAEDQPADKRASAAHRWLKVAHSEALLQHREEQAADGLDALPAGQLRQMLAVTLARLEEQGRLGELLPAIDGEAVEIGLR